MIRLENIHVEYDRVLLENESLIIRDSCITLITGESGIGKSTVLYRAGLIKMDCDIFFNGNKIESNTDIDGVRRNNIGYVLQGNDIIDHLDVKSNLLHYALMVNKEIEDDEIRNVLKLVRLNVPHNQTVMTLSLGQKQRLALACAIIKNPDFFVLDEPTAALDEYNEKVIFDILKDLAENYNKTILIASHSPIAKEYAHCIYQIKNCHLENMKDDYIEENIQKKEKTSLHKNFNLTYIINNFTKYKIKYMFIILFLTSIFILSGLCNIYTNSLIKQNTELLYSGFDKILYVTSNENIDIDLNYNYYNYNLQSEYEHPYIKATLQEDSEVYIIPYYDNQNFDDRLESQMKTNSKHGIYISHKAKGVLEESYANLGTKMELNINVYTHEGILNKTVKVDVLGIMKQGIYNYYNNKSQSFIYMYYEEFEKLCDGQEYIGFVATFDNYDDLKEAKTLYVDNGFNVNETFIDTDAIDEIVSYYKYINFTLNLVIFFVGLFVVVASKVNTFFQRERELVILKINGLSNKEFVKLLFTEFVFESVIALGISTLVILIFSIISHQSLYLVFYSWMMVITYSLFILFTYKALVLFLNIEKTLRR